MFCPNCAAKNEDDVKYCRDCGRDISLVVSSLKGHIPIVLGSKLDKLFDRRNEGLLFNSIIFLFSGIFGSLVWLLAFGLSEYGVLFFLGFYIFLGILSQVQYRRSLSLRSNRSAIKASQNTLYCPVCGQLNEKENRFCSKCGEDLEGIRQTMTPAATGRLARFFNLDKESLTKVLEKQGKQARIVFVLGTIQAFYGLYSLIWAALVAEPADLIVPIFLLVTGGAFTIVGWRNMVAEKRLASGLKQEEANLAAETAQLEADTQRQLTAIKAEDEIDSASESATTRELVDAQRTETETKRLSELPNETKDKS